MTKKIFRSILLVAGAVLLAAMVVITGCVYGDLGRTRREELWQELDLAAAGVRAQGTDYFSGLSGSGSRLTWVAADGTVLWDTQADAASMENHAGREEIRQAMETGYGESTRDSATLLQTTMYAARRLEDGELMCCATWLDAPDSVTFDRIRGGKTLAYIGYPTADGSCGSVMRLYGDIGAFAATASPAGCWEFVKYTLKNGADAVYYGSPVYVPLMREQVAQKNENGGQYTTATEEDVQAYINAAQACRVMGYRDESVMDILRDECAPMLTGEVTPEQAAKNIQARVSLYMAEQYG